MHFQRVSRRPARSAMFLAVGVLAASAASSRAQEGIEQLVQRQSRVQAAVAKAMPATVCIQAGAAMGSGVVINADGLVLTAGHVVGDPNREVNVIFPDGKTVKGKTLGSNLWVDAGMIQITDEGQFPYIELGRSEKVEPGQWCVSLGHPGGFRVDRTPPVRLGRVVSNRGAMLVTDCTITGGDSGGPLIDLTGRLIGIHSSIGPPLTENRHVPVDQYRESWDRLVQGESWGSLLGAVMGGPQRKAFLGVQLRAEENAVIVSTVMPNSPAQKGGVREGDVVEQLDGKPVGELETFVNAISQRDPGSAVVLRVRRGDAAHDLKVELAKWGQ